MTETRILPLLTWRSAICDSGLPPTTRHVALTLSLYMSERGDSAHPGALRLASDTGYSVRAVREHLGRLVATGWVELYERGGLRGNRKFANTYRARIPDPQLIPDGCTSVTGAPPSPVTETAPTGDPDDRDGCTTVTPSLQEPSKTSPGRRKRRTPPPEDFAPTDAHRELASSLSLDIDAERREFIDGAHAHGRIYADHDRAFTQWLRRAPAFGPAKPLLDLETPGGPTFADVEQHARDVGPYACPLELGCDNGWHDSEAGVVRCPCLTKASA